jgi:hypothetical protein
MFVMKKPSDEDDLGGDDTEDDTEEDFSSDDE